MVFNFILIQGIQLSVAKSLNMSYTINLTLSDIKGYCYWSDIT